MPVCAALRVSGLEPHRIAFDAGQVAVRGHRVLRADSIALERAEILPLQWRRAASGTGQWRPIRRQVIGQQHRIGIQCGQYGRCQQRAARTGLPPARRADAGSVRLGGRDVAGLLLCGDMYGAPYDLLAAFLDVRPDRLRGIVARWRRAGYAATGRLGPGRRGAG